jgi:hypothetical protein
LLIQRWTMSGNVAWTFSMITGIIVKC